MEIIKNIDPSKKRDSNIELFRIIMMLSIVAHHYVVNSGVSTLISVPPYSWHTYFLYIFGMWGKIGINCFVLITGYYMCTSAITIRKFLKLFLEVCFYNIVCYLIFAISGYEPFSLFGIYKALLPIGSISKGFVSCFLIYYLLIPYVNILVNNISKKQHFILIGLCLSFFSIMDHLPKFTYEFNYVSWFCILHIIAAYIRFYTDKKVISNLHCLTYILCGTISAILIVAINIWLKGQGISHIGPYEGVIDCNAIFAISSSILLFIGFKNIKIPYNKSINFIASSTFGVLMLHANSDTMRHWLWQDVCKNTEYAFSLYMPIHAIGSVILIFSICVIIDKLRIYIFEKPTFIFIDKWLKAHNYQ